MRDQTRASRPLTRRMFLGGLAGGGAVALLAACGATATPTTAPIAAPTVASGARPTTGAAVAQSSVPTAGAAVSIVPTAAPSAARNTGSRGDLRAIIGIHFPATLDAAPDGFTLVFHGMGETLMRLNTKQQLEPWLAESVTGVDPRTWTVKLRKGARFWDGSPVDGEAVAASFRRNWQENTASNRFLAKDTQIAVVDATTLRFTTPKPAGDFPFSLATQYFVVHKPDTAPKRTIMTGPYRPTRFDVDQSFALEAFPDHWGGVPPLRTITTRLVTDANARILGLQSGDADILYGLPPESIKGIGGDIEAQVIPSTRLHYMMLNNQRAPFGDRAVREATSYGIDRAALNAVALDGLGAPATGLFTPNSGVEVVDIERGDPARARQLLDEAGWRAGADGIRAKDGKRLQFTLYSYPGRAELTPMAVAIQAQLKPLGYDIQVQQVQDITAQTRDGNFDAAMYSVNSVVTGDPQYMFQLTLLKGGASNPGGYSNPDLDTLIAALQAETDPAKRQALSRQGQEIVGKDVPNIYLAAAPVVTAYKRGKIAGFTLHPNDLYWINRDIALV